MSTIAEMVVPSSEFALGETLEARPHVELEIKRVVAHDHDDVMPFVWVVDPRADADSLEGILAADPSVERVRLLDDFGDRVLFQMRWTTDVCLVHAIVEQDATILSATGSGDEWVFRALFPDRSSLSLAHEHAMDHDLSVEVTNIYGLEDDQHARFGLTKDQYETLIQAFDRGFFDVPREITLNEFAEELDVSHQALSERLRRAHANLIENGLVTRFDSPVDVF